MKRALILGVGGQDGSYLAEILLERGYEVHGMHRRSSVDNLWRIRHLIHPPTDKHTPDCATKYRGCAPDCPKDLSERLVLHKGDLADPLSVDRIVRDAYPTEIYNLADQDHVGWSYATPGHSLDITAGAVARLLETVKSLHCLDPRERLRVFQPVSATMFGDAPPPQDESTPFSPQSPYACAKVAAYYLCRYYRQAYGLHVCCGIMFNHDSGRRSGEYLLHQICSQAIDLCRSERKTIKLGCFDMKVDIGHAQDYMLAAWQMMQVSKPDDYVIATGKPYSIRELVALALDRCGVEDLDDGMLEIDPAYARPGGQPELIGNPAKAKRTFGFEPETTMSELLSEILEAEGL